MEPESSLPFSQKPANGTYPEQKVCYRSNGEFNS